MVREKCEISQIIDFAQAINESLLGHKLIKGVTHSVYVSLRRKKVSLRILKNSKNWHTSVFFNLNTY